MSSLKIDGIAKIRIEDIAAFARHPEGRLELSSDPVFRVRIEKNLKSLERQIEAGSEIYGVSTGYGNSCSNRVSKEFIQELPKNLIRYHGCGLGNYLSEEESAATLAVRLISNSRGYSGVRWALLEKMAELSTHRVFPAIPSLGSVGASGDLTPLSYLAALLQGERRCYHRGQIRQTSDVFQELKIEPLQFRPKEALAIMNGTSVMTGIASLSWMRAERVFKLSCALTGLLAEVLGARSSPFEKDLNSLKPHPGQMKAAEEIYSFLKNPDDRRYRQSGDEKKLQDPYSIRCAPQVIGVLGDVLAWSKSWIETEINSVNDNPVILDEKEQILLGGLFYGGHIAAACDALKTSLANVLNLADKQLALLVDERFNRGLPDNLVAREHLSSEAAIHHGFKAMQISFSALTAEALKTSIPMSIFSRSTEALNQDVVSMGTIAARDLSRILDLAQGALSIYAMAIRQALYLKGESFSLNERAEAWKKRLESLMPPVEKDREFDQEIQSVERALFS